MRNLLPHFIQDKFETQQDLGQNPAVTLFVDISGFTAMTETLMTHGDEGAEILSGILNQVFHPVVKIVYDSNGFITNYLGDAFTAIFPIASDTEFERHIAAYMAAFLKIQRSFQRNRHHPTSFGNFELRSKMGIGYGALEWGIVGQEEKAFYFRGPAIDACVDSEKRCEKDELILHPSFNQYLNHPEFVRIQLPDGFVKVDQSAGPPKHDLKLKRIRRPRLKKSVARYFLPDEVINFNDKGEFRNVVTVFISFEGIGCRDELNLFISIVLNALVPIAGYFKEIDFGDKGGMLSCFIGAPVAFENNIERALDFILSVKTQCTGHPELPALQLRAGITYGRVYAGIVGGQERCQYNLIGDKTNLAARYMAKAKYGEIWVSESINRRVKSHYQFAYLGDFEFKGKSDRIPAYRLEAKRRVSETTYLGPFVGRDDELQQSTAHISALDSGRFGGLLYIYGEAGVGKSRLVHELRQKLNHYQWIHLPCDSILKKGFNPFIHYLNRYFDQTPEAAPEINKLRFESRFNTLLKNLGESSRPSAAATRDELVRLKSVLAGFLSVPYPGSLFEQLEPKLRYDNTLFVIKDFFKALAIIHPVVLLLEDLHWIDADSTNVLNAIIRNLENDPLAIVLTSRYTDSGTKPRLPVETKSLEIDLNSFSREGMRDFAQMLLPGLLSEKLTDNLYQKTRGNPFFIEQTLIFYRETGIIQQSGENLPYELAGDDNAVPPSISDLLIARIDRLPDRLKNVIQIASVMGQDFDIRLLDEVVGDHLFEDHLRQGENENVWSVLNEMRYVFAHALLQDVVYRMQLKEKLRAIHQRVAQSIEKLYGDQKTYYFDLAFHYEKAANRSKTLEYVELAGDYARTTYQNQTALEWYDKLLSLVSQNVTGLATSVDAMLKKGEVLKLIGEWDEALQLFSDAVSLAQKIDDSLRLAQALRELGGIHYSKGNYDTALELDQKSLELFEENEHRIGTAKVMGNIGKVYWKRGEYDAAMKCYRLQIQEADELHDDVIKSDAIRGLGNVHLNLSEYDQAMHYYEQDVALQEKLGDQLALAKTLSNIGVVFFYKAEYDKAAEYYKRSLNIREAFGDREGVSSVLTNLFGIEYNQGNYEQALAYCERQLKINQELDNKAGIAGAISNLAIVYNALDDYEKSLENYQKSIEIYEQLQDRNQIAKINGNLGELYRNMGKFQNAIECYQRQIELCQISGNKAGFAIANGNLAVIYGELKEYKKAKNYFHESLPVLEALKAKYDLAFFIYKEAEIYLKLNDYTKTLVNCNKAKKYALESNRDGIVFRSLLLEAEIQFYKGEEIIAYEKILNLMSDDLDKEFLALAHYTLAKIIMKTKNLDLKLKQKYHIDSAFKLYKFLSDDLPNHYEYHLKMQELNDVIV